MTNKYDLSNNIVYLKGICHKYIYERGRTGGWQDMHCSHLFKVLCAGQLVFEI